MNSGRGGEKADMAYVLGIDLGTTNSCAAILEAGEPVVIENVEGGRTTPSVVAYSCEGEWLVGEVARRQAITNPRNTVFSAKRFMGRKLDDAAVRRSRAFVPYEVVAGPNGDAYIRIEGEGVAPQQVSAVILHKLKADVEARLGEEVSRAVITVPAYFDDAQRQATKDAGRIAGLDVLRIVNEPTAAALAYGLGRDADETIAVYDLGGGTFDISILRLGEGIFEVKSTNGNTHLGGDDLDARIIDWLADGFRQEHGIDLRDDALALRRLKEEAERAKIELSSLPRTRISLPFMAAGPAGPLHLEAPLTRADLEELAAELIAATAGPCRQAMSDAGVEPGDIDGVIMVGGQTRMPAVRALVRDLFGQEPRTETNPDEAVALGAAIQGGVLSGMVDDVVLLDVTPLTLGVEIQGGGVAPLLARNTPVPTACSETFTTAADGQDSVAIHVTQGERPLARENRSLARFHLDGIPPARRGAPKIEVRFVLDANGILNVAARDHVTDRVQHVTVTPSSGLSREETERMVEHAARYRERDRVRGQRIAVRNRADALLYDARHALQTTAMDDRGAVRADAMDDRGAVRADAMDDRGAVRADASEGEDAVEETRETLQWAVQALEATLVTDDDDQIRARMERVQRLLAAVRGHVDAPATSRDGVLGMVEPASA